MADIFLTGNIVKVDPLTVCTSNDTLCSQNSTVDAAGELAQNILDLLNGELAGGFHTPGGEHLVGMMMVMIVMVMTAAALAIVIMMMLVVMVVTAAALLVMVVVVMMLMVMVVTAAALLVLVVVVMMLMVMVVTAAALLVMIVVVMMLMVMIVTAAALLVMLVVVMLVIMTAAALLVMLMVMMMLVRFFFQHSQFGLQRILLFHGFQHLGTGEILPGSSDDLSGFVMLTQQCHSILQLLVAHTGGTGQNDAAGMLNLIVEELTEVLHVHLALVGIGNGSKAVKHSLLHLQPLHGTDNIGQLAHTGGLNEDAIGMILLQNLTQSLAKIAHQTAANAAGVHLRDFDAGILQKTAVNADLTELVFDKHQLFPLIGFLNELFDQRGLASAQKARKNVDFRHSFASFIL